MDAVDDRPPPLAGPALFRLWIAGYDDWHPTAWWDTPPLSTALEPVSASTYSAEDAQLFLQGFNSQMLRDQRRLWVVAVPVMLRFEGDLRPGDEIRGSACATACATNAGAMPEDDEPDENANS